MSWPMVPLGEVVTVSMGQAPPGDSYNTRGEGLPLIAGPGDFVQGKPQAHKHTTKAPRVCAAGDLILGIRASIGDRVWADRELAIGRGVAALGAGPRIDRGFLWHVVAHLSPELKRRGKGATFPQVSRSDVESLVFPLPPLPEQRRIASILDQADALRAKRRQVLAHLDALGQSIFNDMFGQIPWTARLRDVATVQTGPFGSLLHAEDYVTGGIPVINPIHIQSSEIRPDPGFSVSPEKTAPLSQFRGVPGDIFLGRRGEMGRAGIVSEELGKRGVLCGTGCLIIRPSVNSSFLHSVLVSTRMKNYLEREALGVTLPNLNSEIVLRAPVPAAPSRELQSSYVRRLEALDSLRSRAESCSSELAEFSTSLQSRAFAGEL